MTRISFQMYRVVVSIKCKCSKCGHNYYRKKRDGYSMNPFHDKTHDECHMEIRKAILSPKYPCPKCDTQNLPKNSV